jgi:glucose 1-dehydrogenase
MPPNPSLSGHVALVTGAVSGIGAACVQALAEAGAAIIACYHKDEAAIAEVATSARSAGAKVETVICDVSDEADVGRAFDAAAAAFPTVDILINSAGLNQSGIPVADMSLGQWQRVVSTDLTGAFLTSRAFIQGLRRARKPGRIVNISSIHATVVRAGAADYGAAKAGLWNLTRTLALECAPLINVNAIAPGMIPTPMNERAVRDTAYRAELEANIPWGRAGTAGEVAALAAFLVSPAADYITGASFTIDGGLSLVLGQGA